MNRNTESRSGRGWAMGALVGVLVVLAGVVGWWATRPAPEVLQGQVEVRRVNVAAKIPGRVDSLLAREGDTVEAGQLVVVLHSPELDAKAQQTDAQIAAARAQEAKARSGARSQEVTMARANWERAAQAESLAVTTYARVQQLFVEGVIATQRRDEAQTQLNAARLATQAARAQFDLVMSGARSEDRTAAEAVVRQAQGGRAEVRAYQSETHVVAPIGGEISQRTVEPGEIVSAGLPILTISDLRDAWVTFNLREDRLAGIGKDSTLHVTVPALGGKAVSLRVSYIAPVGDYATWRSTGEAGGFDLRTFEVRARPVETVPGLRPGMTVLLPAAQLMGASSR
ncbi:efflux RND transporter periplasmic adaptor subunit [Gemmatimonas aurantiaca]|uniref:HlyD family secretion protein n=1 Tax=Gemmatimonas aurantiaca TaxID=173480 RepID=UPI00301BD9F7